MAFNFLGDVMSQALGDADLRRNLSPRVRQQQSPVRDALGYGDLLRTQNQEEYPVATQDAEMPLMARDGVQGTGQTINNGGILSNANNQVSGTSPFRGASTPSSGGLGLLGYEAGPNGNLRPLGISNGNPLMQVQDLIDQASARGPSFDLNSQAGIDAMNQFREASTARAQGHIGSLLQNQLGQNQLDLQRTMQLGTPGVPGAMQNAASDSLNRTRENERYGPEARYDAFYNQAYNSFPPGTPHDARVRQMRQSGMAPPQFLTGGQQRPGSPGTTSIMQGQGQTPRQAPGEDTAASNVDRAFETGLSSFPMNPQTGRRDVPSFTQNPAAINGAITNVMTGLDENALRNPEVRQRLIDQFGNDALNSWLNTSNNFLNRASQGGDAQQTQIQRFLGLAGMRQTPIYPTSLGASPSQRAFSAFPSIMGINYLNR